MWDVIGLFLLARIVVWAVDGVKQSDGLDYSVWRHFEVMLLFDVIGGFRAARIAVGTVDYAIYLRSRFWMVECIM